MWSSFLSAFWFSALSNFTQLQGIIVHSGWVRAAARPLELLVWSGQTAGCSHYRRISRVGCWYPSMETSAHVTLPALEISVVLCLKPFRISLHCRINSTYIALSPSDDWRMLNCFRYRTPQKPNCGLTGSWSKTVCSGEHSFLYCTKFLMMDKY